MAAYLLPSPPLPNSLLPLSHHSSSSPSPRHLHPLLSKKQTPPTRTLLYSSSLAATSSYSSSSVATEEQEEAEGAEPAVLSYKDGPNFRGCNTCGKDEMERGCNGEGRIQGGIATVPGFGWWPIKAYRPCPGFVASGGRYRRQGQSMDEVASGRGKKVSSKEKQSKKTSDPTKLKG